VHQLTASDLRRPWPLLRTRAPWCALLYLLIEATAGTIAMATWVSVVLIPVWLLAWPRVEQRVVGLAGVRLRARRRARWELRWQDIVLVMLTAVLAAGAFMIVVVLATLLLMLFSAPLVIANGRTPTLWDADQELPALPVAILAPLLGVVLVGLLLWAATALARGWAGISNALLGDEEKRLAAQVAALGDENVRISEAVTRERDALERDLHDGAQMHLSAAGMRLALLRLDAESIPNGPRREALMHGIEEVEDQIGASAAAIRSAVNGLVPALLRDEGLPAALAALVDSLPVASDVNVEVPRLSETIERSVHLIASEALTNVARHARAEHVVLRCTMTTDHPETDDAPPELRLMVRDDGVGGAAPTGTGLVGMSARARALGGALHVASPVGGPTEISARIPITRADRLQDDRTRESAEGSGHTRG
jgi:signal transduction histidine kinase